MVGKNKIMRIKGRAFYIFIWLDNFKLWYSAIVVFKVFNQILILLTQLYNKQWSETDEDVEHQKFFYSQQNLNLFEFAFEEKQNFHQVHLMTNEQ